MKEQRRADRAWRCTRRCRPGWRSSWRRLADPALMVPFARFVKAEEELLALLQRDLEQNRAMLGDQ